MYEPNSLAGFLTAGKMKLEEPESACTDDIFVFTAEVHSSLVSVMFLNPQLWLSIKDEIKTSTDPGLCPPTMRVI